MLSQKLVDYYEGVSLPLRADELNHNMGHYVAKLHHLLFELSVRLNYDLDACVIEWLDRVSDEESIKFRQFVTYEAEKVRPIVS